MHARLQDGDEHHKVLDRGDLRGVARVGAAPARVVGDLAPRLHRAPPARRPHENSHISTPLESNCRSGKNNLHRLKRFAKFRSIIIWNFGFPNATPTADVTVAILLSFLSMGLKKWLKF